jgi:hypothetical protein
MDEVGVHGGVLLASGTVGVAVELADAVSALLLASGTVGGMPSSWRTLQSVERVAGGRV